MVFNCWHGGGSCLGLKRGQVGRSERGCWSKLTTTKKPLTSRWICVWANSQNACLYLCHSYFCGFPTQSVTVGGSIDITITHKHLRVCVCVQARTHSKKGTNYFPLGFLWEVIRNVSLCYIFSSVCLGGVVGVSSVFRALLCSVALCLCLQLRAMYIS